MSQRKKQGSRLWTRKGPRPLERRVSAHTVLLLIKALWIRYSTISRVLLIYAISLFALLWLYVELYGSPVLNTFLVWNAEATGFLASLFGPEVFVQDNLVIAGSFAARIVPECTGLAPLAVFLSGVIAFPTTLGHKLWGIILGLVVLSAVNIVRTTSLLFIGMFSWAAQDVAHILVWQSLMIILAVVLWVLWWRTTNSIERVQP